MKQKLTLLEFQNQTKLNDQTIMSLLRRNLIRLQSDTEGRHFVDVKTLKLDDILRCAVEGSRPGTEHDEDNGLVMQQLVQVVSDFFDSCADEALKRAADRLARLPS